MEYDLIDPRRRPLLVTVALVAPLLACAVMAQFRDGVSSAVAALVLVVIVVACASTGDRVAGIAAAVSSALWFDFFLTRPYRTFSITHRDDVEVAVLLVLVGAAVTEIALWGHRQQARASRRDGYIDGVLRVATVAAGSRAPDTLTDLVADEIVQVLDIDGARFVPGDVLDSATPLLQHDGVVTRDGRRLNPRDGLPTDDEIALVVRLDDVPVGHFMLTASTRVVRPTRDQLKVAVLLADQVGAVITPRRSRG